MLIRTWNRGSKNKDGHNAGGARLGAGRKRQDGTMSDQAAILSAVRALKQLTGEDLVGALTITTENGTKISVDLAIKEPVVKLENGDIDIAAPGETGASNVRAGAIIDDDDDEGAEADGLIVNGEVVVERVPAAVQQPLPADVKGKAREALIDPALLVAPAGLTTPASIPRQVPPPPAVASTSAVPMDGAARPATTGPQSTGITQLAEYMAQNPIDPAIMTAKLALISDANVAHTAISSALQNGNAIPEALLPLETTKPSAITGPFMVLPPILSVPIDEALGHRVQNEAPTFYGPVHPSLLPVQQCIAIYYVVYEKGGAASSPKEGYYAADGSYRSGHPRSSGPRTGPGATTPGPSLAAALQGHEVPWPAHIDLTNRKRAPRRCLICGEFDCKGRGGRAYCPQYDPNNPDHQPVPHGKTKQEPGAGSPTPPIYMPEGSEPPLKRQRTDDVAIEPFLDPSLTS